MASTDTACSIHPYFKVHPGKLDAFHWLCLRFVTPTKPEPACLCYGSSFDADQVHCRENYVDAAGRLARLANVEAPIAEALTISDLARLEVHGTEAELAKLREPTAGMAPQFFAREYGLRNWTVPGGGPLER